jgi:serine/threonine protein kinase
MLPLGCLACGTVAAPYRGVGSKANYTEMNRCCCDAESVAPIRFTLEYAAPEIAHAWEAGGTAMTVDRAVDIWALGVAAYELLTQRRAFSTKLSEADIWDQIAGRSALPWEMLATEAPNHFRARIKGIVLTCLHREPAQRPTAAALVQALRGVLGLQPGSTGPLS